MTEEEMRGRVRQLEQVAQRRDAGAFVVLQVWSDGFRLVIHWIGQESEAFPGQDAGGALAGAAASLGDNFAESAAIDDWIKREERAAGEPMRAVYLPGVTGCPRVME